MQAADLHMHIEWAAGKVMKRNEKFGEGCICAGKKNGGVK
jgi:hypothetical protein